MKLFRLLEISSITKKFLYHPLQLIQKYLSRLTRELRLVFPLLLVTLVIINLTWPKTPFDRSKETTQANPADPQPHLFLAQQLFSTNQFIAAEHEAKQTNDPEMLRRIQSVKTQPEEIQNLIRLWQSVVDQFPNFRDAYIQLAVLNWKLYRPFDARKYLEKALELDPNNDLTKKVRQSILVD